MTGGFTAKDMPGSHVIVKTNDKELPDRTFEEAAALAAYYSAAGNAKSDEQAKIEVDYVRRKELKKPPKANPGLVIYHTITLSSQIPIFQLLKKQMNN